MKEYLKATLVLAAALLALSAALSFADAHATDLSAIHVKPPKAPVVYEICNSEGKACHEGDAGAATLALINKTGKVFIVKRTEQELVAATKGITLTNKK